MRTVPQHQAVTGATGQLGSRIARGLADAGVPQRLLVRDHWPTEQHISASGLQYTFLRDKLYADFLPQLGGRPGVLRGGQLCRPRSSRPPGPDPRAGAAARPRLSRTTATRLSNTPICRDRGPS